MVSKTVKLKVKFTEQQIECLDNLKKEGKFGKDYGEIVATIFHEYVKSRLGRGGR